MPMEDELSQNVNNKLNELFHLPPEECCAHSVGKHKGYLHGTSMLNLKEEKEFVLSFHSILTVNKELYSSYFVNISFQFGLWQCE